MPNWWERGTTDVRLQGDPGYGEVPTSPETSAAETRRDYRAWEQQTSEDWWNAPEYLRNKRAMMDDRDRLSAEIADLNEIKDYFIQPTDWVTRWLIDNSIAQKREQLNQTQYTITQAGIKERFEQTKAEYEQRTGYPFESDYGPELTDDERRAVDTYYESQDEERPQGPTADVSPQMPGWMQQYILPTTPRKAVEGTTPVGATDMAGGQTPTGQGRSTFRPLGAQADVSTGQREKMAGYMGWQRAGRPQYFTEGYARQMEGVPEWWEQYVKRSQSLFPSQVRRKSGVGREKWRPAKQ